MNVYKCPVCFSVHKDTSVQKPGDALEVKCNTCGHYKISGSAVDYWHKRYHQNQRSRPVTNVRSWIIYNYSKTQSILEADLIKCETMRIPTFHDRADQLLRYIENNSQRIGQRVGLDENRLFAATWSYDFDEIRSLMDFLCQGGRISHSGDYSSATIEPDGWAHLEKLKEQSPSSDQGFVAMWFDAEVQHVYDNAIAPAIESAGYKPHRVDLREHNDKIDDEIIVQIRRSRFVVADFTGHRGGVYYEAGFAHGLGRELFFTCREDALKDLHFDIRQYNCIVWEPNKLDEFRERLSKRIEAVLGKGNVLAST